MTGSDVTQVSLTGNDVTQCDVITTTLDQVMTSYIEEKVSEWLWKTIPVILFCVGIIGNSLTVLVIWRLGIKGQPTLVFLIFLAVTDSVVLLTGLPRYWLLYLFDLDLKTMSNVGCKAYYFFIYLSMQYSSWILVGVSLERVAKTYMPFTYKRLYSATKVIIGLFATLIVLCLVNGHFFFTNGINDYTEGDCGSLDENFFYFDEHIYIYVDFSLLSLIPFIIMLVSDILLIRILKKAKQDRKSMMHQSVLKKANRFSVRMTQMLVVCTIYFLLATAPISIYFILDTYLLPVYEESGNDSAIAKMDLAWTIAYLLQFSNYCVNFYLYTATNKRFYREMRSIICCCCSEYVLFLCCLNTIFIKSFIYTYTTSRNFFCCLKLSII